MKQTVFALLGLIGLSLVAQAQDRIYRCGNEYTNTVPQGHEKGCKLVEGGNVTVVQGQRPAKATAPKRRFLVLFLWWGPAGWTRRIRRYAILMPA
jgi:hypothetical protein